MEKEKDWEVYARKYFILPVDFVDELKRVIKENRSSKSNYNNYSRTRIES